MSRLPNFLYIGPAKAGSTWIYDVLARHPQIFMAPGKGLYFFTSHYDQGLDWYRGHFRGADGAVVVGEVSHTYLASAEACGRIAAANPGMRLMVCLREPVQRLFSDYLDGVKNGQITESFEQALERYPELCDGSRYARHLAPYLERFGRQNLHVGIFDELEAAPDRFAARLFAFLGVSPQPLAPAQRGAMLPAAQPRSRTVVKLAKRASHVARELGLRQLRGRAKTSRVLRSALYRPFEPGEKPRMAPQTQQRLRGEFREELRALDALLGSDFLKLWRYA